MAIGSPGIILKKEPSKRSKKKRKFFKDTEKPHIRKFEHEDMWILWAAYKEGTFNDLPDMEKEQFYALIRANLMNYHFLFLVEDNNKKFKSGRGAVCLIGANTDGWKFEPHVTYFKWATKYNIIRTTICFLSWISFNKDVGVCLIRSLKETTNLFRYMKNFIGINYVGMIPSGDYRGDEYLFSIFGKKANGLGTSGKRLHGDGERTRSASPSAGGSDRDTREEVPG